MPHPGGVPKEYLLPIFPASFGLNIGVYFVFVIAIIAALFMKHTVTGMKLKASGMNMDAAKAAGISVNRMIVFATLAGAACAGFAGGMEVLGVTERLAEGWALAWGTTGGGSCAFRGFTVRYNTLCFHTCSCRNRCKIYASYDWRAFSIGKSNAGITRCFICLSVFFGVFT